MKTYKKIIILIAIILFTQNLFADIFDRIATLTNAVNYIRATTNTCEKITPFNLLKSCGIAECLLERADMTEKVFTKEESIGITAPTLSKGHTKVRN